MVDDMSIAFLPKALPTLADGQDSASVEWAPRPGTGMRMSATLARRGRGEVLSTWYSIERRYTDGIPVAGKAARLHLNISIASDGARWAARLVTPESQPLTLKGDGDLTAGIAAAESQIITYARAVRPRTLWDKTAVPFSLYCPSGGELVKL